MKTAKSLTIPHGLAFSALVLILGCSAVQAGHWDSAGSKPGYASGAQVQRYSNRQGEDRNKGYTNQHSNRNNTSYWANGRNRNTFYNNDRRNNSHNRNDNVSVNVIVATPSIGRSNWNNRYTYVSGNRWNNSFYTGGIGYSTAYRPYQSDSYFFNSSRGYLPGTLWGGSSAIVVNNTYINRSSRDYVKSYEQPVRVISREADRTSISLFKDRYGTCYEREFDSRGNETRREVAASVCNF